MGPSMVLTFVQAWLITSSQVGCVTHFSLNRLGILLGRLWLLSTYVLSIMGTW